MAVKKQNDCTAFVRQLRTLDFSRMRGIPKHCDSMQLHHHFPAIAGTPGRGVLGQARRPTEFWLSSAVNDFCGQLRIWFRREEIVRLDLDFPLSFDWERQTEGWGQPQARQDYYFDNILFKQAAYVWLLRGISILFNAEQSAITQILIYQPCSIGHYQNEIFLSLPTREIAHE